MASGEKGLTQSGGTRRVRSGESVNFGRNLFKTAYERKASAVAVEFPRG
jgi:hypothetical protein